MKLRYLLLLVAIVLTPWVYNAYKLTQCDFESNYRCEAIHAVGVLIPPAAYVTVWFEHDSEKATIN